MIFIFAQKCIETLEAEDDGIQVQGGAENHLEVPQGYQSDAEVQRGDQADTQVQGGAENCMEVPQGYRGDVEVQRGTANCMQLLERDADVRQPFQQGWKWSRIFPGGNFRPKQIRFTGEEKVLERLPTNPIVEDFFKLYITEEMIDHLVVQTNLYARQFLDKEKDNLKPHSRVHEWKPTDRAEMLTFLAILILMGIVHKPRLPMSWSTDSILVTPIFNLVMRRDRFLLVVRFICFADNTKYNPADPDRDKLYKIREVINMIKYRCGKVYSPGKSLSMDESLVLFKGRLSFKQYISSKRARFGIKLYQLCTFHGILLDFIVYYGNLETGLISLENCLLITERIPATVMQKYLNKGHHLFIDNYYTSISLAEYLKQNGTYVTRTIREHRKHFPVEMKTLRLEKGDAAFYQHEDVVVAKYTAKKNRTNGKPKEVYVLSTAHAPAMGHTNKRDKEGNTITKPTCIISYMEYGWS